MIRGGLSTSMNCRFVRSLRNASADSDGRCSRPGDCTATDAGFPGACSSSPLAGMAPTTVTENCFSTAAAERSFRSSWLRTMA